MIISVRKIRSQSQVSVFHATQILVNSAKRWRALVKHIWGKFLSILWLKKHSLIAVNSFVLLTTFILQLIGWNFSRQCWLYWPPWIMPKWNSNLTQSLNEGLLRVQQVAPSTWFLQRLLRRALLEDQRSASSPAFCITHQPISLWEASHAAEGEGSSPPHQL